MTGPILILTLKVLVITVTVLFLASLAALARGNVRLHGRINTVFFVLTMITVFGLEIAVRFVWPNISAEFFAEGGKVRGPLMTHLWFSVPAAVVLPVMFYTGSSHRRTVHLALATVFSVLWVGTFVTGVFFLPHGD